MASSRCTVSGSVTSKSWKVQRGAGQDRVGLSKEAVPHLVERGAIKWVLLGYGGRFRHNRAFCGLWGLSDLRNLGGLGALGASGASVP